MLYRWDRYQAGYIEKTTVVDSEYIQVGSGGEAIYFAPKNAIFINQTGTYPGSFSSPTSSASRVVLGPGAESYRYAYLDNPFIEMPNYIYNSYITGINEGELLQLRPSDYANLNGSWVIYNTSPASNFLRHRTTRGKIGSPDYVYSTDESAYPLDGEMGGYWYDNRQQIDTPSAPSTITVPQVVANQPVTITWGTSTAQVGNVVSYTLQRSVDGSNYTTIYTGANTSYQDTAGDWATVAYRVFATDNYGSNSSNQTSSTQDVQDGLVYVSFLTDEGEKPAPFTLQFSLGVSGSASTVTGITTTGYLDSLQVYSDTLSTGTVVDIPIDVMALSSGQHIFNVVATKESYVGANQNYTFTVPTVDFPDKGYGIQLQNEDGEAILPETFASLVMGYGGKSVADNIQELMEANGLTLTTGTYNGTGSFGQSTPNTLSFNITPKMVIISDNTTNAGTILPMINGNTNAVSITATGSITGNPLVVSWSTNNVSWYNTSGAAQQLNVNGNTYSWVMIG